jgi:hypothetical protein
MSVRFYHRVALLKLWGASMQGCRSAAPGVDAARAAEASTTWRSVERQPR